MWLVLAKPCLERSTMSCADVKESYLASSVGQLRTALTASGFGNSVLYIEHNCCLNGSYNIGFMCTLNKLLLKP